MAIIALLLFSFPSFFAVAILPPTVKPLVVGGKSLRGDGKRVIRSWLGVDLNLHYSWGDRLDFFVTVEVSIRKIGEARTMIAFPGQTSHCTNERGCLSFLEKSLGVFPRSRCPCCSTGLQPHNRGFPRKTKSPFFFRRMRSDKKRYQNLSLSGGRRPFPLLLCTDFRKCNFWPLRFRKWM